MSKLKMLKFEAATLQLKSKSLVEQLQKLGVTELEKIQDKRLFESSVSDTGSSFSKGVEVLSDAMSILTSYGVKFSGGMFSGRRAIDEAEYDEKAKTASVTLDSAYDIIRFEKQIADASSEIVRCNTLLDSLTAWEKLDIPTGGVTTESSVIFSGSFPKEYSKETLCTMICENLPEVREYEIQILHSSNLITSLVVICHKSVEKQLYSYLRSLSFTPPPEVAGCSVTERMDELNSKIDECNRVISSSKEKIMSFEDKADLFKFAYDYFTVKCDEYEALSNIGFSESTIYIKGYVPEICAGKLSRLIEKNEGAIVYSTPSDDDDAPVMLSNGKFSEPVEAIVEMYSMPGKFDIDPSKAMAFFYYLLFGMMLSDAGYGLVLFLGSLLLLKFTGVEGSMRRMLKMFVYCGISTVFWGALFGSWFGDAIPVIAREFFGHTGPMKVALWFDPISDPITLLLFSFVIGICHLFLGLILMGYMKWKQGDKIGALCDTVPIILTVTGAAPLAAGVLVKVPSSVTGVATYMALIGVVLIILTSSRSGNIFFRLGGGLYALYNIASGYLSDILSYSRLLALGLATGSIGSVVNMLAVMVDIPGLKVVIFILVFILGHTLNMAINVLGAYVHTNRLQFVELFSKFYEGGGRAFTPFRFNTKYFKLKEDK